MGKLAKHHHQTITGAWVVWEPLKVLDRFREGRTIVQGERHEVLDIGKCGLEFTTVNPPDVGRHALLNVYLPGDIRAFSIRGVVSWVRRQEGHRVCCVVVKFDKCPIELADRVRELRATMVSG